MASTHKVVRTLHNHRYLAALRTAQANRCLHLVENQIANVLLISHNPLQIFYPTSEGIGKVTGSQNDKRMGHPHPFRAGLKGVGCAMPLLAVFARTV